MISPHRRPNINDREHLVVNVQLTNYWGNGGTKFWDEGVQGHWRLEGWKQIGAFRTNGVLCFSGFIEKMRRPTWRGWAVLLGRGFEKWSHKRLVHRMRSCYF